MDMATKDSRFSFRSRTRQRTNRVGTIPFSASSETTPLVFPKIGYLATILLFVVLDVSNSSTVTAANLAPYSILNRIKVTLNNGSQTLFDASGYGAFLVNSVNRQNGRPDQSSNTGIYQFPTSSGSNQTLVFGLEIPISMSDGHNFEGGLINLQAPEIQCTIGLNFAAASAIGSNMTINSGNVYVSYKYYEVPNPVDTMQPPLVIHKWQEDSTPVTQTGENIYTVPTGGRLLRAVQNVILNGSRSDSWDERSVRVNTQDYLYLEDRRTALWQARRLYGYDLPTGVHVWDFAEAWSFANESDGRDYIDTEATTTLELITKVSSGATLGTGNNSIKTIRETVQLVVA